MTIIDVLAVDDDPWIGRLIEKVLSSAGLSVESVLSAEDAINRLGHVRPRVIIADVNLPDGMDGFQFCQHVRAQEKLEVPILMLTASGEFSDRVKGFQAGAVDYMVKPFNRETLLAKIESLLGASGLSSC